MKGHPKNEPKTGAVAFEAAKVVHCTVLAQQLPWCDS